MNRYRVETRAEVAGNRLRGYAAVYGPMARIGNTWESIAPGAFDEALKRDDVVALVNHDASQLLGRTEAGTLRLGSDSRGLEFEVDLPNTAAGDAVREYVSRGDMRGASFGFIPGDDQLTVAKDGRQHRTHTRVAQLIDVSVVTLPAYADTEVALRAVTFPTNDWRHYRARLAQARMALHTGEPKWK